MMIQSRLLAAFGAMALLLPSLTAPLPAAAQEYTPTVGQEGKDVVWVPTPEDLVATMLDMAKLTSDDYLIDLGSGDGRTVIAAAKRGARALGIEYNPDMVDLSKSNAQKAGVSNLASFVCADLFESDFSQATVLTLYLLPNINMRLRPTILKMKPGTRVVSHAFNMEDWNADRTEDVEGRNAYLWIVPAQVAGTWAWQSGSSRAELTLKQTYQKIDGSLRVDGKELPVRSAKLEGDRISLSVEEGNASLREYAGRVNGNAIEGTSKGNGPQVKWTAMRLPEP